MREFEITLVVRAQDQGAAEWYAEVLEDTFADIGIRELFIEDVWVRQVKPA